MKGSEVVNYLTRMIEFYKDRTPREEFQYCCIEDFVLKNGLMFTGRQMEVTKGRIKECYCNAWHLADGRRLVYVEGFAVGVIPVMHAWCVDEKGNIYDPTWEDGREYFGVPFDLAYVTKVIFKKKTFGVLDHWEDCYPLLRGIGDFKCKLRIEGGIRYDEQGKGGGGVCNKGITESTL